MMKKGLVVELFDSEGLHQLQTTARPSSFIAARFAQKLSDKTVHVPSQIQTLVFLISCFTGGTVTSENPWTLEHTVRSSSVLSWSLALVPWCYVCMLQAPEVPIVTVNFSHIGLQGHYFS